LKLQRRLTVQYLQLFVTDEN